MPNIESVAQAHVDIVRRVITEAKQTGLCQPTFQVIVAEILGGKNPVFRTKAVNPGAYCFPLEENILSSGSSFQDVRYGSGLVLVDLKSAFGQIPKVWPVARLMQQIRNTLSSQRVTGIYGESYTHTAKPSFDVEVGSNAGDVIVKAIEIWSYYREPRYRIGY